MGEVFGIDVSHHNGKIQWDKVAKADKKFAIMKAQYEAQSHRIDETFEYNYAEAGKNGLARGVYIYIARASVADPVKDANMLVEKLKGRNLEYGIWLDLEDGNIRNHSKQFFNDLIDIYVGIFRAAGYYVGIYCNRDWYNNVLDSKKLSKEFDFWIARYPKNDKGIYNANSTLNPKDVGCAWQYSSKGKVDGISTRVDLNVDFDGVINLVNAKAPVVEKPKEEPKPVEKKDLGYTVGKNYKLKANMYIRKTPNGKKLTFNEITVNARSNAYAGVDGAAILKSGTVVTCKDVSEVSGSVWVKIPSGWVCGKTTDRVFIS